MTASSPSDYISSSVSSTFATRIELEFLLSRYSEELHTSAKSLFIDLRLPFSYTFAGEVGSGDYFQVEGEVV